VRDTHGAYHDRHSMAPCVVIGERAALLRQKIRIKGSPKLLMAFGRCFPS